MLLEPAFAEARTEEIEDDEDDVEGGSVTLVGTAVMPLAANTFCWETPSLFRGLDIESPLGTLGALELKLPAGPLMKMDPFRERWPGGT